MTLHEFVNTDWHRGNTVRLNNGKEYLVKGTKGHGKYLLLYSEEYDSCFVADFRIVDTRTSDYEEPEEIYLEKKRLHQEAARIQREAERLAYLEEKAERKRQNILEQERLHQEALARKEAKRQKQLEKQQEKQQLKEEAEKKKVLVDPNIGKEIKIELDMDIEKDFKANTPNDQTTSLPNDQTTKEPAATAEPAPVKPKRIRKRITVSRPVKIEIK